MKESTLQKPLDEALLWAKFYQEKVAPYAPNETARLFVESHTDDELLQRFPAFLVDYAEARVHEYFGGPLPDPDQYESEEAALEALKKNHPGAVLWFVVVADGLNVLEALQADASRDHLLRLYDQLVSSLIRGHTGFFGPELEFQQLASA